MCLVKVHTYVKCGVSVHRHKSVSVHMSCEILCVRKSSCQHAYNDVCYRLARYVIKFARPRGSNSCEAKSLVQSCPQCNRSEDLFFEKVRDNSGTGKEIVFQRSARVRQIGKSPADTHRKFKS